MKRSIRTIALLAATAATLAAAAPASADYEVDIPTDAECIIDDSRSCTAEVDVACPVEIDGTAPLVCNFSQRVEATVSDTTSGWQARAYGPAFAPMTNCGWTAASPDSCEATFRTTISRLPGELFSQTCDLQSTSQDPAGRLLCRVIVHVIMPGDAPVAEPGVEEPAQDPVDDPGFLAPPHEDPDVADPAVEDPADE